MSGEIRPDDFRAEPVNGLINLGNQRGNWHANSAILLRDKWCLYFNTGGTIPWQGRCDKKIIKILRTFYILKYNYKQFNLCSF